MGNLAYRLVDQGPDIARDRVHGCLDSEAELSDECLTALSL